MKKLLSVPKRRIRSTYNIDTACHFLSNEFYSSELLAQIGSNNDKPSFFKGGKTAIVFGESHWISILPELSKRGCRVLILADINPLSLKLFEYMRRKFEVSSTIAEFKFNMLTRSRFQKEGDSQVVNEIESRLKERAVRFQKTSPSSLVEKCRSYSSNFWMNMMFQKVVSGDYHFLSSKDRFDLCKQAFLNMEIRHEKLNVLDERECKMFADDLFHSDNSISLINLTNIADYDFDHNLRRSISSLLEYTEYDPLIMCSTATSPRVRGPYKRLESVAVHSVQDYFKYNSF